MIQQPTDETAVSVQVVGENSRQTTSPSRWQRVFVGTVGLVAVAVLLMVGGRIQSSIAPGVDDQTNAEFQRTFVFMPSPTGAEIAAQLSVVSHGETIRRILGGEIFSGFSRQMLGPGDQRLRMVDDTIVYMAHGSVMVQEADLESPPENVGEASYLLPSTEAGHVWAVGSASRTVRDVDVSQRSMGAVFDLDALGVPVGTYGSGLVVVPRDQAFGDFAVWSPIDGLQPIGAPLDSIFLGGSAHTLIFSADGMIVRYDVATAVSEAVVAEVESIRRIGTVVSPDAELVAIPQSGSVVVLPTLLIVDTRTGVVVDRIDPALEWQIQWLSPTELVYMRPALSGGFELVVRDVLNRVEETSIEVGTNVVWFTAAS